MNFIGKNPVLKFMPSGVYPDSVYLSYPVSWRRLGCPDWNLWKSSFWWSRWSGSGGSGSSSMMKRIHLATSSGSKSHFRSKSGVIRSKYVVIRSNSGHIRSKYGVIRSKSGASDQNLGLLDQNLGSDGFKANTRFCTYLENLDSDHLPTFSKKITLPKTHKLSYW